MVCNTKICWQLPRIAGLIRVSSSCIAAPREKVRELTFFSTIHLFPIYCDQIVTLWPVHPVGMGDGGGGCQPALISSPTTPRMLYRAVLPGKDFLGVLGSVVVLGPIFFQGITAPPGTPLPTCRPVLSPQNLPSPGFSAKL